MKQGAEMKIYTRAKTLIQVFAYIFLFGNFSKLSPSNRQIGPEDNVFRIYSRILDEERPIRIYLPDSYASTMDRYTVLYHLDGTQRNFSNAIHQIEKLVSQGEIPKLIVVGIENTDRWRDMLPVKISKHPTSGEADRFLKFIQQELITQIERKYRTNSIRILHGCSNSALFAIFTMMEGIGTFNGIIAGSPSIGHCVDYLTDGMESYLIDSSASDQFLSISNGGRDTALKLITPIPDFVDLIESRSSSGFIFQYKYYEEEGHCPTPTLTDGLKSFFQYHQAKPAAYKDERNLILTPQRFAPGVVSTDTYSETGCTFTPDGKTVYFTRSGGDLTGPTVFISRYEDDAWTSPEKAPFSGFGPCISPDGKMLVISKYGYDTQNQRTIELWVADAEENEWKHMRYLGPGNRPSMSQNDNLYYVDRSDPEDRGVIVMRKCMERDYSLPERVGGGVNTPYYEAHPCIAEDESYIIFDSTRPGGYGEGDLYICFNGPDGSWEEVHNLGSSINSAGYEAYSSISPVRRFLFFSSDKGGTFDLYSVDLNIIEKLR